MRYGLSIAVLSVGVFILAGAHLSVAEDTAAAPAADTAATQAPEAASAPAAPSSIVASDAASIAPAANEPDVLWLWGDVVAVDAQKNELTVKFLDYESDNEKEIPVTVNEKTVFENAKMLADLKAQDTVSIDYVVVDGKNVARNISVEKPENIEPVKDQAASSETPDVQPAAADQAAAPAADTASTETPAPEAKQ